MSDDLLKNLSVKHKRMLPRSMARYFCIQLKRTEKEKNTGEGYFAASDYVYLFCDDVFQKESSFTQVLSRAMTGEAGKFLLYLGSC